ncbi:MAG: hypothetical protein N2512_14390 [Armatimonadetes bacterium]|nr:hypothetical protein [Armatimonadota bacterium]
MQKQSNPADRRRRLVFDAVWQRHHRAETTLVRRCKAGDLDALTALAYALADELWAAGCLRRAGAKGAAAPGVVPSSAAPRQSDAAEAIDASALDAAVEALNFALRRLEGWSTPSLAQLRAAALARLAVAPAKVEQTLAPAPPEVVLRLAQAARAHARALSEGNRRRNFWRLQGYAVVGALVLSVGVMLASYQAISHIGRVPPAVLDALQFRVRHSGLATAMRDLAWELPDPAGMDRPLATALEETALILDEIAALSPAQAHQRLPFMAARIARRSMTYVLEAAAEQEIGQETALLDACLVLQEVENCFGPGGAR